METQTGIDWNIWAPVLSVIAVAVFGWITSRGGAFAEAIDKLLGSSMAYITKLEKRIQDLEDDLEEVKQQVSELEVQIQELGAVPVTMKKKRKPKLKSD